MKNARTTKGMLTAFLSMLSTLSMAQPGTYSNINLTHPYDQLRFVVPGEPAYYLMSKTTTTNDRALALYSPDDVTGGSWFFSVRQGSGDFQLHKGNMTINNGHLGVNMINPNAQVVVGDEFGAIVSGAGGGIGVFGSNLAVYNAGPFDNDFYTPYSHANFGYAGMRTGWGKVEFFTAAGSTTANEVVSPATRMIIDANGNVGIGMNPSAKLHVDGTIQAKSYITVDAPGGSYRVAMNGMTDGYITGRNNGGDSKFSIRSNGNSFFNGGNVGIGTENPDAKLTVKGTVHAEEVKVDLSVPGPDYVFENDYPLPSLDEVAIYIGEHKHLPEVPSAKEMEANGVELGEMNMVLLRKVEELTLYVIELKRENDQQREQTMRQQQEIEKLKKALNPDTK